MANYVVSDTNLSSIADAIRAKAGNSNDLVFPTGFVNAINALPNVITGTFKGTTTNTALDINLPYTGNGYPVAVAIYPEEGTNNSNGVYGPTIKRYTY